MGARQLAAVGMTCLVLMTAAWLVAAQQSEDEVITVDALVDAQLDEPGADGVGDQSEPRQAPICKGGDTNVASELELLEKVRTQTGSPLEGSLFDRSDALDDATNSPDDHSTFASFAEAYYQLAQKCDPLCSASPFDCIPHGHPPTYGAVAIDERYLFGQTLRDAARALDAAAADLEDRQAFERSDELRRWAQKLRFTARRDRPGDTQ